MSATVPQKLEKTFPWMIFYRQIAAALSRYEQSRPALFTLIHRIAEGHSQMDYLHFNSEDFWAHRAMQIDPFTVLAIFNRNITDAHRKELAELLGQALDLACPAPEDFHGIPAIDTRKSIFDGNNEMWNLWQVATGEGAGRKLAFAFEAAIRVKGNTLTNLSAGLFWANPLEFMPINPLTRPYLEDRYGLEPPPDKCTGMEYAQFLAFLRAWVMRPGGDGSFPAVTLKALQLQHAG